MEQRRPERLSLKSTQANLHDLEPGSLVVSRDGRVYEVDDAGSLRKRSDLKPEQAMTSNETVARLPRG